MVRAAAKNHPSVAVVVDPSTYGAVLDAVRAGGFDLDARRRLAARAFAHTAAYDTAVAQWCARELAADDSWWPAYAGLALERADVLRYGENPHQKAALYVDLDAAPGIARARSAARQGDVVQQLRRRRRRLARRATTSTSPPSRSSSTPTRAASRSAPDVAEAHRKAHACDPVSAFGGVIATNRAVTVAMAEQVAEVFTEVVVAPAFEPDAFELLRRRRTCGCSSCRTATGATAWSCARSPAGCSCRPRDQVDADGDDPTTWTLAAGEPADDATLADLAFAWRACRAVKSNAILLATDGATVGVGMGQVNRVDSAGSRWRGRASGPRGSVAASDAFFPFADGLEVLLDAGVRAVVQPGGSMRDEEVVGRRPPAGVTLYLTGDPALLPLGGCPLRRAKTRSRRPIPHAPTRARCRRSVGGRRRSVEGLG